MGLDVRIEVRGTPTPVWPPTNRQNYVDDINAMMNFNTQEEYVNVLDDGFQLNFLMRYYGPWYERGIWPTIAAVLKMIDHMYPGFDVNVYYGDDTGRPLRLVDRQFLEGMWAHYWSENGHAYHNRRRDLSQ